LGLGQEQTNNTNFLDFLKKLLFVKNTAYKCPDIFKLCEASDHKKMSGAADASKNISNYPEFNHLLYIGEDEIHFLVHRFRGRRLPEKALNNQGGINIGSTPGRAMTGRLFRYTKMR
jgi:hypothetical protein